MGKILSILIITLSLVMSGCNKNDNINFKVHERRYNPLVTVGVINNIYYNDVERLDYLTYSVFRSRFRDGYLYQRFITILTESNSRDIRLIIESDDDCGTRLSTVTVETIDNIDYNRLQYHITCDPNVIIVYDNSNKYHYSDFK